MEEGTRTHPGPHCVRDSSGGKNIRHPGLRCGKSSRLRSNARVCECHAADHSVNARTMSTRGLGCAAGFCVFQMRVQDGAAASTLPNTHPEAVAESFLHVGHVVVRRQDTSRARVQVAEPFVGDLRVAQVLNNCHLLPSTFGEECVLQTPETRPISEPESCPWSCGALSRLFRSAEKSISSPSSSWKAEPGCSRDAMVDACSLQSSTCLLPS